jgi:hypothetical protein
VGRVALTMLQQTRERNKRESEVCLFSPLMVFVH